MYEQIKKDLLKAYDGSAQKREAYDLPPWKIELRDDFLRRLQQEDKTSLLEIGAGTGKDSAFFQDNGLQVVCTDLSPKMIALCRDKGLDARVMDFTELTFADGSFDALYAMNTLLHVPPEDFPGVLEAIKRPLKPSGLFFYGVYGGFTGAKVWQEDDHEPKRFYANYSDEDLLEIAGRHFTVVDFKPIILEDLMENGLHFQRLILRNG